MKFLCGSCKTKYQIADERVRGVILTILCRKCGARMAVREAIAGRAREGALAEVVFTARHDALEVAEKVAVGAEDTPVPSPPSDEVPQIARVEWFVAREGEQQGPMSFTDLARLVVGSKVGASHYVWHEGLVEWRLLRDEPSLKPFLPPPAPPPLPKLPATGDLILDLFADFPPPEDKVVAPRPVQMSTRMLLESAGVSAKDRRARLRWALAVGGTIAVALIAFVLAWAGGVVSIAKIKSPFSPKRSSATPAEPGPDPSLSSKSVERLADDPPSALASRRKRSAPTSKAAIGGSAPRGPRGGDPAPVAIDADMADGAFDGPPSVKLPAVDLKDAVLPDSGASLKSEDVVQILRARRQSIETCYSQALKAKADVRGKVELDMTIDPSGSVAKVRVLTQAAKARSIGECIAERIKDWHFPAFSGKAPQEVRIPFLLENGW